MARTDRAMDQATLKRLRSLERRLVSITRIHPLQYEDWASDIPKNAGVYALWSMKNGKPIYVGETASLQLRMIDIGGD